MFALVSKVLVEKICALLNKVKSLNGWCALAFEKYQALLLCCYGLLYELMKR